MTRWEQLLGGYATGNLTPGEHDELMREALSNQALFDALMDEEALREALADPETRQALLRALQPAAAKRPAWWRQPWLVPAFGAVAAAVALLFILRKPETPPSNVTVAQRQSIPAPVPAPPPAQVAPLPSKIDPPKQLTHSEVPARSTPAAPALDRLQEYSEAKKEAMPPPPPPPAPAAVAVAVAERGMAAAAPPPPPPEAARSFSTNSAVAKSAAPAQTIMIAWASSPNEWRDVDSSTRLPAGQPLRLRFSSRVAGTLRIEGARLPAVEIAASHPAEINLPPQAAGDLNLTFAASPAPYPSAAAVGAARQLRAAEDSAARERSKAAEPARKDRAEYDLMVSPRQVQHITLKIQ